MSQILKIDDEQVIIENERKIQRFIFNDDKIVKVDLHGNVITENVSEKYLHLISIFYVQEKPSKSSETKKQSRGLTGWLVGYVVVLSASIVASIIMAITDNLTASECSLLNLQFNGACTAMQPLLTFENIFVTILIIFDVIVLILLLMQKKHTPIFAIILLIVTPIWNILDTAVAFQVFSDYNFPSSITAELMAEQVFLIICNIVLAGIFIPCFIKSEKVKTTLIK